MAPTVSLSISSFLLLVSSYGLSQSVHLQKRAAVVPTPPAPWTYAGCWTEGNGVRALSGSSYTSGTAMTDEACITYCGGKSYAYAGTEYASECYCGNTLDSSAAAAPAGDCSMACSGNANEICGAGSRLTIFKNPNQQVAAGPVHNPGPAGWTGIGCYTDSGTRALGYAASTTGGSNALTVALCTAACKAQSYTYAGVEYAGECYCGNTIGGTNGPAADGLTGCNMPCNGNASEYCGGPNRLDMYKSSGGGGGGATPTTSTGPAPTGSGTNVSPLPSGWTYKGCYIDNANGRVLTNQQPDSQTLTVESCVAACAAAGYVVAGMEYSTQCFCDSGISNGGVLSSSDTDCSLACGGNAQEKCGAGNRLSIYAKGTLVNRQPPAAQTSGLPGSWTYKGCATEGANARIFKYQIINTNNNTATACLNQCATFGFMVGAVEYGDECYCGDLDDFTNGGSTAAPATDCNVPCSGDSTYYCGGGNRLSWYQWTGTPLYKWTYATGNAAGSYKQLIGGVCIPLLTALGTNNKYQFVEKYGTGEPNSTGAYELDLSQISNPSVGGAWRAMHVKTDVFCSAGLTLPDKVGRQINIGGWSGDSLFGIRIYWPDGSPGVASTHDWQENVAELKLQVGRWYPSAMTMTNGSILIVGGENGSNGPPQPSLELLPTPGGGNVVTLDFLQRTDPFNLYPFLAVVPSGILICYYNEARILDEVTFATKKVIPNLPGNVNNFQAGRTYPLEGTAMLMPQYAPYSAPLTILICGGSTTGAGTAIDNCVSTQPEAANPVWTIERMPSQRVISCMTALPDGTYMILNGAHQGVAGFGLATSPNLNAVLYDPSKPVNQRMTVMANTTVARLYHSESTLMQDGRVMVSGSDPQDGTHPEEYRVEVFSPPYALSGLPAPAFTITNTDWSYGASVTFTVTKGSTANLRVSLIGATVSTHGNSMGQRTLFPAVSCAGTTCTVTAPPNVHTCPLGWYQMFVLDGPTPSLSTWVRIGGDPGNLGNWPNYADFIKPGV